MINKDNISYQQLWQTLTANYEEGEAKAIVRLLLDKVFGLSLTDLVADGLKTLSKEQLQQLEGLMERLQKGEPIQYVIGEADFCGRAFTVQPGVLIPRPETERLCQYIAADNNHPYCAFKAPPPLQVLDVGTGSGCIAITLALDLFRAEVTAWDVSPDALILARDNARSWEARVNFEYQDALQAPNDEDRWDIIVSNPPYVTDNEKSTMHSNVLDHEPHVALFVPDDDPLLFYRAIAKYGLSALKKDGAIYFEINPRLAEEMKSMLQDMGYKWVTITNDQFGKPRYCKAFGLHTSAFYTDMQPTNS